MPGGGRCSSALEQLVFIGLCQGKYHIRQWQGEDKARQRERGWWKTKDENRKRERKKRKHLSNKSRVPFPHGQQWIWEVMHNLDLLYVAPACCWGLLVCWHKHSLCESGWNYCICLLFFVHMCACEGVLCIPMSISSDRRTMKENCARPLWRLESGQAAYTQTTTKEIHGAHMHSDTSTKTCESEQV